MDFSSSTLFFLCSSDFMFMHSETGKRSDFISSLASVAWYLKCDVQSGEREEVGVKGNEIQSISLFVSYRLRAMGRKWRSQVSEVGGQYTDTVCEVTQIVMEEREMGKKEGNCREKM